VAVMAQLIDLARRRLRALDHVAAGLVVAVSGGPDSVALLRVLLAARDTDLPLPLVVAHLNHQLRGAESDADEDFVVRLHGQLLAAGTPAFAFHCHRLDVASLARSTRSNLEACARQERYRWLAEVARTHGMHWVATGHTANDQVETVLHQLLRGTGLRGLRGIAAQRGLDSGVGVVRPLLQANRADVLACLEELGQPSRQDSSNDDPRYTRNRIRHELLPQLAANYNPGIVAVLGRLAEQANEMCRIEEEAAKELLRQAELPRAGALVVLDLAKLSQARRHLVRSLFRLLWSREGWPLGEMGFVEWDRLADLVFDVSTASDFPGNVRARRRERVLQLGRTGASFGV
jgi:tRNA(Ile)-lysidine synthase